ncbi:MAG TPA: hypothetical protein VFA21_20205 [Pyrinomonadaceae bacterium]|jgi:hypothetical protein|nr:hypothetical protein [Pyrinomonadaceae bacterium]
MTIILGILVIIAGIIDLGKDTNIGLEVIGAGVVIVMIPLAIVYFSAENDLKRRRRISSGSGVRPQVDSQGRFYCNACGGYVSRHDPSNHPECN